MNRLSGLLKVISGTRGSPAPRRSEEEEEEKGEEEEAIPIWSWVAVLLLKVKLTVARNLAASPTVPVSASGCREITQSTR
jgi:hypothetical protein